MDGSESQAIIDLISPYLSTGSGKTTILLRALRGELTIAEAKMLGLYRFFSTPELMLVRVIFREDEEGARQYLQTAVCQRLRNRN